MDKINLNGRDYLAADTVTASAKIGIAITTHNRNSVIEKNITKFTEFLPVGAKLVIVDDGSATPVSSQSVGGHDVYRSQKALGIVAAKNRCLEILMDEGCDHLFLFDDDAYPMQSGWEKPYIESGEGHLSYQFADIDGPHKLGDIRRIYDDGEIVGYTGQRGVMLYYTRGAISKVGGFDKAYGRGMYEHPDLAMRIYAAGLTSCMFGDVVGSEKLIYSMDQHLEVKRSIPDGDRQALDKSNGDLYRSRMREFMQSGKWPVTDANYSYSKRRHFVCMLLTGINDPQRPGVKFDHSGVKAWVSSIEEKSPASKIVILTNDQAMLKESFGKYCEIVTPPLSEDSIYFQKWALARNYIRQHTGRIMDIFVTDGTDVILRNDPPKFNDENCLAVGDEPDVVDSRWMINSHPSAMVKDFIASNGGKTLLNAGIAGGHPSAVYALASRIVSIGQARSVIDRTQVEKFDMGVFNVSVQWLESNGMEIISGAVVNTVFKSEGKLGSQSAWFQHK